MILNIYKYHDDLFFIFLILVFSIFFFYILLNSLFDSLLSSETSDDNNESCNSSGTGGDPEDPDKDKLKKLILKIKTHLKNNKNYYIFGTLLLILSTSCYSNNSCYDYMSSMFSSNVNVSDTTFNSENLNVENGMTENIFTDVNPSQDTSDAIVSNELPVESMFTEDELVDNVSESNLITYRDLELPTYEDIELPTYNDIELPKAEESHFSDFKVLGIPEISIEVDSPVESSMLNSNVEIEKIDDSTILGSSVIAITSFSDNSDKIIVDLSDKSNIIEIKYSNPRYYYRLFKFKDNLDQLPVQEVDQLYEQRFKILRSILDKKLGTQVDSFLKDLLEKLKFCTTSEEKERFIIEHFQQYFNIIDNLDESDKIYLLFQLISKYDLSFPNIKYSFDPLENLSLKHNEFCLNFEEEDLRVLISILQYYLKLTDLDFNDSDLISILDTYMDYLNSPNGIDRYYRYLN